MFNTVRYEIYISASSFYTVLLMSAVLFRIKRSHIRFLAAKIDTFFFNEFQTCFWEVPLIVWPKHNSSMGTREITLRLLIVFLIGLYLLTLVDVLSTNCNIFLQRCILILWKLKLNNVQRLLNYGTWSWYIFVGH